MLNTHKQLTSHLERALSISKACILAMGTGNMEPCELEQALKVIHEEIDQAVCFNLEIDTALIQASEKTAPPSAQESVTSGM